MGQSRSRIPDGHRKRSSRSGEALFGKIASKHDVPYSEEMIAWATSKDFVKYKQPVYLRRSRGITKSPKGEVRDLEESMERLANAGLAEKDPDLVLTWTKEKNIRKVGYCSVLMKVIAISSVFDNGEIPGFVLDYVVYHEYLHASRGMKAFGRAHDLDFREDEIRSRDTRKLRNGSTGSACTYDPRKTERNREEVSPEAVTRPIIVRRNGGLRALTPPGVCIGSYVGSRSRQRCHIAAPARSQLRYRTAVRRAVLGGITRSPSYVSRAGLCNNLP